MSRATRGRKFVNPNDEPLIVEPLTTAGDQPWHAKARRLRSLGWFVRAIAEELGVGFGPVQRFLNPESKAKQKARQKKRAKERRADEPKYAKKVRDYNRRYAQAIAPQRWKE